MCLPQALERFGVLVPTWLTSLLRPGQATHQLTLSEETKTREEQKKETSRTSGSCPPPTRSSPSSLPSSSPPASKYIELENGVIFALRRVLSEIRPF